MPLFSSKFPSLAHRLRRLSSSSAAAAAGDDPKLSRIADELLSLSPAELDDYAALLRLKLRLSLTSSAAAGDASPAAGDAAAAAAGGEEAAEAKTAFDVKIEKYDAAAKIKIIKEVRAVTDLGLKEAKELVEKAPVVVRAGLSKEEAEALATKLKAAGAAVALEAQDGTFSSILLLLPTRRPPLLLLLPRRAVPPPPPLTAPPLLLLPPRRAAHPPAAPPPPLTAPPLPLLLLLLAATPAEASSSAASTAPPFRRPCLCRSEHFSRLRSPPIPTRPSGRPAPPPGSCTGPTNRRRRRLGPGILPLPRRVLLLPLGMATSALLRALRRPSSEATQRLVMNVNMQAVTGYRHLNLRNLSVFNEFSKQLKGEAKSNPEFQKSMEEFNEKLGVVKDDLKVRTKKTAETIYKSVDDVWTEAGATSKKVTANVKEKIFAAKEEVKETFRLGKEETLRFKDGSPEAATHEKTEGSSQSYEKSQDATSYHTLYSRLKSTLSSASPVVSGAFAKLKDTRVSNLAKQGYDIVKDELSSSRNKKKHAHRASAASVEKSTRTDIVIVPMKKSVLGEKWEAFKNKMRGLPIYKSVTEYTKPVVTIGQEVAEDVRERWETSDNPVVQKIQDLNESIFEETATAVSFREIRRRDPYFSLSDFVADVQEMIKPVLTAYSKGDVETLKKYCTKEVIERCKGERQAYASQGIFFDNKILHISEADVRETKMLGSAPIIIVGFQTQQIYCVRDREGQITEGGQDTIQTVYYAWAMQLMDSDEVPEEESYYPVWRLREMQQVGIKALI